MHVEAISHQMDQLLKGMQKNEASDLHLKTGVNPYYRVSGRLRKLVNQAVMETSEQVEELIQPLMAPEKWQQYLEKGSLDFAYRDDLGDRYRINVFRAMGDTNVAFRRINSDIPNYEALRLPPVYGDLVDKTFDGLILVGGVTGCGKSTTLAAMLEHVNATRSVHIITIEDPIEYTFRNEKAIVSQREVGLDVPSFHDALHYMVREDPDVVFIGEMRDQDTMLAAIQASETGHLVFGSIHTQDCMQSLARILEFFPRTEHDFIRSSLANSLAAVCCQRLIPSVDPEVGRVPSTEVLVANATVREKIRRNEDEDIPAIISGSADDGMRNFTHSLAELIEQDMIDLKTGLEFAPNREALMSKVKGIEVSAQTMVSRVKS